MHHHQIVRAGIGVAMGLATILGATGAGAKPTDLYSVAMPMADGAASGDASALVVLDAHHLGNATLAAAWQRVDASMWQTNPPPVLAAPWRRADAHAWTYQCGADCAQLPGRI
ncbi:hypothetical protein [Limobrevibacterium gyesilva]|uniref:Uncharacterized protein n=1 Tax=Limobrevibacterium gyesilva TaxID=2991712 RepID=A0AA41YM77_9PROT|nr:hypothetical protein [Limobrevibacterium gyesilva]MCW3475076.1 hypothetical protein [Limobrevibacterium gyesilva]